MKKLLLALAFGVLAIGSVTAFGGRWNNNCNGCPQKSRRACPDRCPKRCPKRCPRRKACPTACPERKPRCFKTIKVPVTIEEERCIEVDAIKTLHPQPDIEERIPQAPTMVKIPLPQQYRVECRPNPDKVVFHKQEPLVSWHCPSDCKSEPTC